MSNAFVVLCSTLKVNSITTTKYHRRTIGQVEQFNSTIVIRLCHYVSEHQKYYDTYL